MKTVATENYIVEKAGIVGSTLSHCESLTLPGVDIKLTSLGTSLVNFTGLKTLDLSRNLLSTLEGIEVCFNRRIPSYSQYAPSLRSLSLYYNRLSDLNELRRLRLLKKLESLDIRLNPMTKTEPHYRLFTIHILPHLRLLDERLIRDSERRAAYDLFGSNPNPPSPHRTTPIRVKPTVTSPSGDLQGGDDFVELLASLCELIAQHGGVQLASDGAFLGKARGLVSQHVAKIVAKEKRKGKGADDIEEMFSKTKIELVRAEQQSSELTVRAQRGEAERDAMAVDLANALASAKHEEEKVASLMDQVERLTLGMDVVKMLKASHMTLETSNKRLQHSLDVQAEQHAAEKKHWEDTTNSLKRQMRVLDGTWNEEDDDEDFG